MTLDKIVNYWKAPWRWILGLLAVVILYHWGVLLNIKLAFDFDWAQMLNQWDSGWYTAIVENGYRDMNFAFYPLYPLTVQSVLKLLPSPIPPGVMGALLSTVLFAFYGILVAALASKRHTQHRALENFRPLSPLAWFFMIWSPASYCFQTHHTEALFLILSVASFLACEYQRFVLGAVLAGLCSVTKNQGVFVAVSVGFWWACSSHEWRGRCRNFLVSGLISGSFFSCFMLYSYLKTGDITAFYSAQSHWRPEMTWKSYFKALWFGNSWQNTNLGSLERYALFLLLVGAALGVWRKHKPLGLYVALFVGVMPLSGEFVGTFRYATVLWPAWFWFAEKLENAPKKFRMIGIPLVILYLLYLNHHTTRNYALGRWSY